MSFLAPTDYTSVDTALNLNHLVKNPPATFFLRVQGNEMEGNCVHDGDLLIVDRSLDAIHGCLVVATLGGELIARRVHRLEGIPQLQLPDRSGYHLEEFEIWGIVAAVIHSTYGTLP